MKLLLDENLSFRLINLLATSFPDSQHTDGILRLLVEGLARIETFIADPEESLLVIEER